MGLMKNLFNNTRKPQGTLGKMMVKSMNSGHAKVSAWGMEYLPLMGPDHILDAGCGGGKSAETMLKKYPGAHLTALDYSEVSVDMATKNNEGEIKAGRCRVIQGDVSNLPFEDGTFDLATAFETVYFWPGPEKSFGEICRTLKPGGTFLIVNESDGTNDKDQKWVDMIDGMRIYSESDMIKHLQAAGFGKVEVHHHPKNNWIAFVAEKTKE